MSTPYWIKLWNEILDDPKMGTLPDNVWRRCIELFMFAGELNAKGQLPSTEDIAWRLRLSAGQLVPELDALEAAGIIEANDNGWFVVAFAERQRARTSTERSDLRRKRLSETPAAEMYNVTPPKTDLQPSQDANVTQLQRNCNEDATKRCTDKDKDKEEDKDTDSPAKAPAARDKLTPAQEMFTVLTEVCEVDLSVISKKDRGAFNQAEARFRKNGYCPKDVKDFKTWWDLHDWRGEKGQPPQLNQIRQTWGQYLKWTEAGRPGRRGNHNGPKPGAYDERNVIEWYEIPDYDFSLPDDGEGDERLSSGANKDPTEAGLS